MSALLDRHRWLMPFLTAVAGALGCLLGLACLAALGGCGPSTWQRAASATAVAAVAADRANASAYERIGQEAITRIEAEGGTLAEWCEAVRPAWEATSRIECGIVALADLAVSAEDAVNAGSTPGPEWAGAVCGAMGAVEDAWTIGGTPPAALTSARALVCGLAVDRVEPEACQIGPVPGCEEVP